MCDVDACVLPLQGFPFTSSAPFDNCLAQRPAGCSRCLADHSGIGFCRNTVLDSGFVFPRPVPDPDTAFAAPDASNVAKPAASSRDCRAQGPAMRCLDEFNDAGIPDGVCREMSCTPEGQLLIGDAPCDPSALFPCCLPPCFGHAAEAHALEVPPPRTHRQRLCKRKNQGNPKWSGHAATAVCPDEVELCQTPGTLTCAAKNDCNARGDCFQGQCFCYIGFGGPSCELDICTTGCGDVRAPPPRLLVFALQRKDMITKHQCALRLIRCSTIIPARSFCAGHRHRRLRRRACLPRLPLCCAVPCSPCFVRASPGCHS